MVDSRSIGHGLFLVDGLDAQIIYC